MFKRFKTASLLNSIVCRHSTNNCSTNVVLQKTAVGLLPVTNQLNLIDTQKWDKWPMFQVMDQSGTIVEAAPKFNFDEETVVNYYKMMLRVQAVDDILYNAQVLFVSSVYTHFCAPHFLHLSSETRPHFVLYAERRGGGHTHRQCGRPPTRGRHLLTVPRAGCAHVAGILCPASLRPVLL